MKKPYKTLFTFVQTILCVAVCALSSWAQNLTFQIVSYDCNSGLLQYKFSSSDNSQVDVSLPGIFGGAMSPNTVASYTFPSDGRIGRTVAGTASQSGNTISINFTSGCNISSPPPPNPPGGGNLTKVRYFFRNDGCGVCRDRCAQSQIQGSTDNQSWTTLAVIPSISDGWNEVSINTSTVWRYVRYQSSGGCYGELMELEFYNGGTKLSGTPFGSAGIDASMNYSSVFDGNLATLWHGTQPGTHNFAGLDLESDPGARLTGIQGSIGTKDCSTNSPNRDPNWNWRTPTYDLYFDVKQAQPIQRTVPSPFYFDPSHPIVGTNDPNNQADMFPEDGWMLVSRDFGSPSAAPIYPSMFLYNKYKGILRVFIFRSVYFTTAYQTMSLSLSGNNNEKPQLMNLASPNFENALYGSADLGLTQTAIVKDAGNYGWMVADFNVSSYDPSINSANFNYAAFNIKLNEVTSFDVNLEGKITLNGTAQPVVRSSGSSGPSLNAFTSAGLTYATKSLEGAKAIAAATATAANAAQATVQAISSAAGVVGLISAAKDFLNFVLGGSGGSAPTPYNINLTGPVNLAGKINQSSIADVFPLYLKNNNDYCYRAVQDIPWGVVTYHAASAQLLDSYELYPEQYPGKYYKSWGNFNINVLLNPALGMTVKSIRLSEGGMASFKPIDQFRIERYPAFEGDFLYNVAIELTLQVNTPTRNLGNEVVLYHFLPILLRSGARIAAKEESTFLPYPNPSNGRVMIPMQSGGTVDILNLDGKLLWSAKPESIDTNLSHIIWGGVNQSGHLVSDGMYLIKLQNGEKAKTHKVLIKR